MEIYFAVGGHHDLRDSLASTGLAQARTGRMWGGWQQEGQIVEFSLLVGCHFV